MSKRHKPTSIITGHSQADYDAIAAMVAAKKLHPEALLLAPSFLRRQTNHPFTDSLQETFGFIQAKDCDLSQVHSVILVDGHHPSRFEHIHALLAHPGLSITVYDHHPHSEGDLPVHGGTILEYGSTTTILTLQIANHNIPITPEEATLFGLGIYEDTGSFSFSSTCPEDFKAAAILLRHGMDLTIIKEINLPGITKEQVHLLDTLLKNAITHTIQGIDVTLTEIILDSYQEDFASIIHQLMHMENLKAVFCLAVMEDRIYLIGRSELAEVNAGQICAAFGGGGHNYAASAVIKLQPLAEVRSQILTLLVTSITPHMLVNQYMTRPAKSFLATDSLCYAEEMMNRYGLKAAPIINQETKECVGILEQQTASLAVTHKLGALPVTEYMQRNIQTLTPRSTITEALEIILKMRQRLIPIIDNGLVVGVITRTDTTHLLVDKTMHLPDELPTTFNRKNSNMASRLHEQLPKDIYELLQFIGKLGDTLDIPVFAVGGFVRDLLLKRPNFDIDISVEGDFIVFAKHLAVQLNGRYRTHPKFKTAQLSFTNSSGEPMRIDIATARLEYYERPAALPTVERSSIKMDLYRRDFTINALAIQLNNGQFGTLIDPFGALRDIKDRSIAILHSLSFVEDPTRILRAIRFEQRFKFRINAQTERLIKNALSLQLIKEISGTRLFNEFKNVCAEKEALACLERMEEWGILSEINPILKLNEAKKKIISNAEEILAWYNLLNPSPTAEHWIIYLLALCYKAKQQDVATVLSRFNFIGKTRNSFLALRQQIMHLSKTLQGEKQKNGIPMSRLHKLLTPVPLEGLLYLMALYGQHNNIAKNISLYLTQPKNIRLEITGEDLKTLGEKPGPLFTETLDFVRSAKIDGKVTTREEELQLAKQYLASKHALLKQAAEAARTNITQTTTK